MSTFAPETAHALWLNEAPRALRFADPANYMHWRHEVDVKLRELVGVMPPRVPLNIRVEFERPGDGFVEKRIVFTAEAGADVPCHLLVPTAGRPPYPVVICLQGHSPGMHISLGRAQNDSERETIAGGRDYALQAVKRGYAALALEQRCFGERADRRPPSARYYQHPCIHATLTALLLGRTMIGQRVWDVSRAIDALGRFTEIDPYRIAIMGNSGGGTISWYAACLDSRLTVAMPSCSICTYGDSIGSIDHCADNYLPGALRWFDMGDLACLIAPRPLVVVAGREDRIFPIAAVEKNFQTIQRIYEAAGAPQACRLVVGQQGHRFYPEESWPVFAQVNGW